MGSDGEEFELVSKLVIAVIHLSSGQGKDGGTYFVGARSSECFDFNVVNSDHLHFKTHDGHQGLDINRILLLKLKAVGESHGLLSDIFGSIFRDLLDRDYRGKWSLAEWEERHAIEFEAVALGGKLHLEIARDILFPDSAFWALGNSIGTTGAVNVDGLRLLGEGGRIERRGLLLVDFERDEEGVGGQRQRRC